MANGFTNFLTKFNAAFKVGATQVLPFVTQVAVIAQPFVDLALPAEGPLFNLVTNVALQTEAMAAAQGAAAGTGPQKLATVTAIVGPVLMDQLTKAGVSSDQHTAAITNYINAAVAILNGPVAQMVQVSQPVAKAA